jgi:serine/threonine protein kinase
MQQNVKRGTYAGEQMKALAADDPRVIGEYRLRAQLGAGGMGRVYLGLSPGGRAVAIKVVHPELASDADFLRRFAQEVAAARAVSGIYTAPVVASGLNERPPWLATAFVPGPSLEQIVTEHGPLPEQALWPLLGGLVEALQAIHACGVVHRDLKPANVLLATDGPRVIDFGISRAADGTSLTAAGVVFGTPGYMSPEQAEGRGAGPESDVFALACVVAYGATGVAPFGTGTAAAVLYRVVHAEPDLDRIPPRLRDVLAACLAKNPADRPTLRALSRLLSSQLEATGPSAVAFWPSSVAGLIGDYQARLELETRNVSRPPEGFSWATARHQQTTPSDPGRPAAQPSPAGWPGAGGGASPSPAPSPSQGPPPGQGPSPGQGPPPSPGQAPPARPDPSPRWPYGGPNAQAGSPGDAAFAAGAGVPAGSVSQGYPQPQGYAQGQGNGAQAPGPPYAPPQGYPSGVGYPSGGGFQPGGAQAGYPQPYRAGARAAALPMPATMITAVRLMYAGAAYAVVWAAGVITVSARLVKDHPAYFSGGNHPLAGAAALAVLLAVAEIVLWLGIARACRRGRNGARVAGTILFGINTLVVLGVAGSPQAGLGPAKLLSLIGWLIGAVAVVFLWRRASSAFFAAQAASRR